MTRILTTLIVLYSLLLGAACDKAKTLTQLENVATEMRIHNRNIAKVANDFHAEGKLSNPFHAGILTACDRFSKALDLADAAIVAAKKVTGGAEARSALDYAQRLLDVEVFGAFADVAAAVIEVPAEVKEKMEIILASVRALFATLRTILAEANPPQFKQEAYEHVG